MTNTELGYELMIRVLSVIFGGSLEVKDLI
jgi:hypothetical protein